MDRSTISESWVNPRTKSPCSIANCLFTRGYADTWWNMYMDRVDLTWWSWGNQDTWSHLDSWIYTLLFIYIYKIYCVFNYNYNIYIYTYVYIYIYVHNIYIYCICIYVYIYIIWIVDLTFWNMVDPHFARFSFRQVLLITDGVPTHGDPTAHQAAESAGSAGEKTGQTGGFGQ